jgi:hypothetical protein
VKLMDQIWSRGRGRGYGVTALLAVLTFGSVTTAADVVRSASDQQPAGTVFVTPPDTPAATTTDAPAPPTPVVASAPQAVGTQPPSVQSVTEPAPEPGPTAPAPEPPPPATPYDPAAPWTDSAGVTYVPAVPVPMEPLPGENQAGPPAN